jgi:hypothetical protein
MRAARGATKASTFGSDFVINNAAPAAPMIATKTAIIATCGGTFENCLSIVLLLFTLRLNILEYLLLQ